MTTILAIAGCARVKMIGSVRSLPIINAFYVVDAVSPHAFSGVEVLDIATGFALNWSGFPIDNFWSNGYTLSDIEVTALDTISSPQATVSVSQPGTDGSTALPPEACMKLLFHSTFRGRSGRNALYISPCGAGKLQDSGHWDATTLANRPIYFSDWVNRAKAYYDGIHGGQALAHVVASPINGVFFAVTGAQVQGTVRSQRRRQG